MHIFPDFEQFKTKFDAGESQVIWATTVADLETPVSAMMKLCKEKPYSFLFESVEGGAIRGRYSFIGYNPDLIWRHKNGKTEINRQALNPDGSVGGSYEPCGDSDLNPLHSLRDLIDESRIDLPEELPPMAAGVFGYMGYDMVRHMERLPDANDPGLDTPDSIFSRPTMVAIFDQLKDTATLVSPIYAQEGITAAIAYELAVSRIARALDALEAPLFHRMLEDEPPSDLPEPQSTVERSKFHEMVAKAKEYIYAGDIFQVVLSQRFSVPFTLSSTALYRSLRRLNPSPFLYHLGFEGFSIVGSSPEILVRLRDDEVTIRPIAGTRIRGANKAEDEALAADLLSDEKELAEHLMLLDLGRNDVGRVSEIGSISVTERNIVELYSHVMHIVSNVTGQIRKDLTAIDAIQGGFPAGTVSGAPKVRAMEIIDELEPERRGIYAGAIGYFSANGSMDNCIALRTAIVKDGMMHIQAGAGVVADSDPESEYQECRNKARALVRAAEEAVAFAANRSNLG